MDPKRKSLISPCFFVFLFAVLGVGGGCATSKKHTVTETYSGIGPPAPEDLGVVGPPEPYGPAVLPQASSETGIAGGSSNTNETKEIKPIVLVFGSGSAARGFAYVGALRALTEAKIPIGAIITSEMGSIVAALYGFSKNLNQFEWYLQKLKGPVIELPKEIRKILENKNLEDSKIPLYIANKRTGTANPEFLFLGSAVTAVRASLASEVELSDLVREARGLGKGPVVVMDVAGGAGKNRPVPQVSDADDLIQPNMFGISPEDFNKKTEAAYRGKAAIQDHISTIKKLVGLLPRDGASTQ